MYITIRNHVNTCTVTLPRVFGNLRRLRQNGRWRNFRAFRNSAFLTPASTHSPKDMSWSREEFPFLSPVKGKPEQGTLWTPLFDPRFPTTNQTKNCWYDLNKWHLMVTHQVQATIC